MITLELEQGTPEWFSARLGIPTASRYKDIVTPARGDKSKSYMTYLYELLAERMTGESADGFTNANGCSGETSLSHTPEVLTSFFLR